jgi:hypothetical protein
LTGREAKTETGVFPSKRRPNYIAGYSMVGGGGVRWEQREVNSYRAA